MVCTVVPVSSKRPPTIYRKYYTVTGFMLVRGIVVDQIYMRYMRYMRYMSRCDTMWITIALAI